MKIKGNKSIKLIQVTREFVYILNFECRLSSTAASCKV